MELPSIPPITHRCVDVVCPGLPPAGWPNAPTISPATWISLAKSAAGWTRWGASYRTGDAGPVAPDRHRT